jgi:malonyl-ACP O-methyltransferase BioC
MASCSLPDKEILQTDAQRPKVDKEAVQRAFRAGGATYEQSAVVQKTLGKKLVTLVEQTGVSGFARVLEIGCCTGYLTEQLCRSFPIDHLFINDIVPEFCAATHKRLTGLTALVEPLPGDIEGVELPVELDLVISSATFQWLEDLDRLVDRVHWSLRSSGLFAFSIFTQGTMAEISAINGSGLGYLHDHQLLSAIARRFSILTAGSDHHTLFFANAREILRHVRETGVGGTGRRTSNPGEIRRFEREYQERFATGKGLPLSYCSTHILARKN